MKSSTTNIADQFDDEGLISNSSLKWNGRQLLLTSGEKVWVKPIVRGVAEILRSRPDLWRIAKLHVDSKDWISARAPIFGVPFDIALRQLLAVRRLQNRPIKSMFQRVDAYDLESNRTGIVATMVAHLSFDVGTAGPEITLEMWQIPNVEAETFYIHGIFLPEERCFVHLDGATMYHDANGVDRLFRYGKKTKGYQKENTFGSTGQLTSMTRACWALRFCLSKISLPNIYWCNMTVAMPNKSLDRSGGSVFLNLIWFGER
jgi:hypothetical protein